MSQLMSFSPKSSSANSAAMPRALFACLLLFVAGCFEVRSEIFLEKDGSGRALVSYAIPDGVLQGGPFGEFISMDANGIVGLDRNKIAAKIEARQGLKVKSVDVWTDGNNHYARLDISFEHIANMGEKDITYSWAVEDGGWLFRMIVEKKPGRTADSPVLRGLTKSLGDKGFFFKVHLPGKIVESNSESVNWNVAEFSVPMGFYLQSSAATKVYFAKIEAGPWDRLKAWLADLIPS